MIVPGQQIIQQAPVRFSQAHKDSFGFLRTALAGVTTWTDRQIRNSGIVLPHIAKNDLFSMNIQLNHDLKLDISNLDGYHIHMIPISAPVAGDVVAIDYKVEVLRFGDTFPDILDDKSGTAYYTFLGTEQYKHLYFEIAEPISMKAPNTYSTFVLVTCQRRNDAQDTYAGEIALLGADIHYIVDRFGSKNEYSD